MKKNLVLHSCVLTLLFLSCKTFVDDEQTVTSEKYPLSHGFIEELAQKHKFAELANLVLQSQAAGTDVEADKKLLVESIKKDLSEQKGISLPNQVRLMDIANFFVPKSFDSMDQLKTDLSKSLVEKGFKILVEDHATNTNNNVTPEYLNNVLKAVVTIYIDKGFRVERGMGIADRVLGTGFFVDTSGYLITNYHVIQSEVDPTYEGKSELFVKLSTKPLDRIPAKVVAWDKTMDLALVKVEIDAPAVIHITNNESYLPGTQVFALGSPGGLENTVTRGIVSASGRRLLELGSVMQVDAAVNPGNSGGPLLGPDGNLSGVVFAGMERFEGINFVIPSSILTVLIKQMMYGGEIVHGFVGLQLVEYEGKLRVSYVFPNSPASRADIKAGDYLETINGKSLNSIDLAQRALLSFAPLERVSLGTRRGGPKFEDLPSGTLVEKSIFLVERQAEPLKAIVSAGFHKSVLTPLFGLEVQTSSKDVIRPSFTITNIVPYSIAYDNDIQIGDRFTLIDFGVNPIPNQNLSAAWLIISIERRNSGFAQTNIQLTNYLTDNNFL